MSWIRLFVGRFSGDNHWPHLSDYRGENIRLGPSAQEHLAFITSSVLRMDSLVKNLLAYARTGMQKGPTVSVSLDEEVEAALSQLAAAIEGTGARVTHDRPP